MGACCGSAGVVGVAGRGDGNATPPPPPPPPPAKHRGKGKHSVRHSSHDADANSSGTRRSAVKAAATAATAAAATSRKGSFGSGSCSAAQLTAVDALPPTAPVATPTRSRVRSMGSSLPGTPSSAPLALSIKSPPAPHGLGCLNHSMAGSADPMLSELFRVSASSSPTGLADQHTEDDDDDDRDSRAGRRASVGRGGGWGGERGGGLQGSFVEVSQPTQSCRGDLHTYSEMDALSEWEPPSLDRAGRRPERRLRASRTERSRLPHLLVSEAEARSSLTAMYAHQHSRLLRRLTTERFIAEHVLLLQEYQTTWVGQCSALLAALEQATRERLAREWWAERAALVRRVGPPPPPPSLLGARRKREDSPAHVSASNTTAADLTSSEEVGDDEATNVRSPSTRFHAAVAPTPSSPPRQWSRSQAASAPSSFRVQGAGGRQAPLLHPAGSQGVATITGAAATASPSSFNPTTAAAAGASAPATRVTPAQQALYDRVVRGRRLTSAETRS